MGSPVAVVVRPVPAVGVALKGPVAVRVNAQLKGETGAAGPAGFSAETLRLPSACAVFAGVGAGATENKPIVGQSVPRIDANNTGLLTSGTPVIALVPLPAGKVISGVGFFIVATEGTPANRTHLWVAGLNSALEVLAEGLDYTSSTFTPLGSSTFRGLKFAEPFETGSEPANYYALLCEVMSSANPITIAQKENTNGVFAPVPILGGTGNAGQTTPGALPSHVTLTTGSKQWWLGFF